jgi:hypothetical protein
MYRYGRSTKAASGVRLTQQLLDLLNLTLRHGYRPAQDYYRYRMYRFSKAAETFLSSGLYFEIRERLYEDLGINPVPLADKRVFYRACEEASFPVPETIADFERGAVRWWRDSHVPLCSLFSKEAASMCGAGAESWIYTGNEHWRSAGGGVLNEALLIERLSNASNRAPLILQRKLENIDALRDLGPSGLCTVRVVTIRDVHSPSPEILLAAFRMPAGGGVADNFAAGGIACPVNPETGTLGPAVQKSLYLAHVDLAAHPDTGAVIAGRVLPLWRSVVELALRAHRHFSAFPSIGWDIAITPGGPVLVEGNYNWDVVLSQQAGCRPLGHTIYVEHVVRWFEYADSQRVKGEARNSQPE